MARAPTLPYELRLAVTGHRQLSDPVRIGQAIEALLEYIDKTLNHQEQTPLEWTIVSPLARGADRIVASAVLRRPGAHLEVISPFRLDDYRKDFRDEDDRAEFERLLADRRTRLTTELEGAYGDMRPEDSEDVRRQVQDTRNEGYLEVGRRVVGASEILIAVWNGERAAGRGGTGDIVEYAVLRGRIVLRIDPDQPEAPPQLIRARPLVGEDERIELEPAPLPDSAKQLSIGYHQLAAYNRDTCISEQAFALELKEETATFRQHATQAQLTDSSINAIADLLLPHYVKVDRQAMRYQARYLQSTKGLHYLAAMAITAVVVQILFFPQQLWLISLEILCMAGAAGWLLICRREAWHEKWLHDRYLAEQLRAAMYTVLLSGTPDRSKSRPEHVLPFYAGPQDWLGATATRIFETTRQAISQQPDLVVLKKFLVRHWLRGQVAYHRKNAIKEERLARGGSRQGLWLFAATAVLAVLHFFGVGHDHHAHPLMSAGNWITLFAIILPAWGAALHAIHTQMEHERIATRSARMAEALTVVADRCDRAETLPALRAAISEAEHVIGLENHEWSVMLSFRGPVLPV
jgi:hypothetical protein